jgi:hypothetical protein
VNFPHAPARNDGILEVLEELRIAGRFNIAGSQLAVKAHHLIYESPPEFVEIVYKGTNGFSEFGLAFLALFFRRDKIQGKVSTTVFEAPVPSFDSG